MTNYNASYDICALIFPSKITNLYDVDSFLGDHNEVIQTVPHNVKSVHPHHWTREAPLPQQAVMGLVGARGAGVVIHVDQTGALTALALHGHVLLRLSLPRQIKSRQVLVKVVRMLAFVRLVSIPSVICRICGFGDLITAFFSLLDVF